jgi:hypothetical protein
VAHALLTEVEARGDLAAVEALLVQLAEQRASDGRRALAAGAADGWRRE